MVQTLQLVSLRCLNGKSVFVYQTDNQQNGRQVRQGCHYSQRHAYIGMNPFILVQKELMIELHKYIG